MKDHLEDQLAAEYMRGFDRGTEAGEENMNEGLELELDIARRRIADLELEVEEAQGTYDYVVTELEVEIADHEESWAELQGSNQHLQERLHHMDTRLAHNRRASKAVLIAAAVAAAFTMLTLFTSGTANAAPNGSLQDEYREICAMYDEGVAAGLSPSLMDATFINGVVEGGYPRSMAVTVLVEAQMTYCPEYL
jgi:TolA-binding protein